MSIKRKEFKKAFHVQIYSEVFKKQIVKELGRSLITKAILQRRYQKN